MTEPEADIVDEVDVDEAPPTQATGADRRRPAPRQPPSTGGSRNAILVVIAAGFALLAVVLAVMVVRFKSDRDDLVAKRDSDDEIARNAGDLAAAMMQFDFQNPAAGRTTVERIGGTQVISQYDQAQPLLTASFQQAQAVQAATIKQIYIQHGSTETEASALVIVDLALKAPGVDSTLPNVRLEMTFAKIDGQWKVTNVNNLNELLAGRGPQATSQSTTTTTAPPGG